MNKWTAILQEKYDKDESFGKNVNRERIEYNDIMKALNKIKELEDRVKLLEKVR